MADHKKQHFIPRSYLKAWCDPSTPPDQEPYVWLFAADGTDPRRKAPDNIFHETDLYTIHGPDATRDLRLEHGLAGLESEFVAIRDTTLARRQALDVREHVLLCAFLAAQHARTPRQRDHLAEQWGRVLEKADRMREWAKTATPEQKQTAAGIGRPDRGRSLTYDQVKAMAEKPLQTTLPTMIQAETPLLARLNLAVLTTSDPQGFITSDSPCVWFDPEGYKRAPFFQAPALMYPSIEITLPVSPGQMVLLNRQGLTGYLPVPESVLDDRNRRTRFHCGEHFVTNTNATRPIWFDRGTEPEDSWRKQHPVR
jgi:hypothetical protein